MRQDKSRYADPIRTNPSSYLLDLTSLSNNIKGNFAHHYDQRDD